MRLIHVVTLTAGVVLWASCSGDTGSLFLAPGLDAGASGVPGTTIDADMPGAIDSDGSAYPSANIGGRPKSATQAGQIFPNLTFPGVLSAATADTQAVVSMSDYYDPQGLRYDLLHVIAIFMWCPHCNNETYNLATIAGWQASQRVAVIQIAMQGYNNATGASPTWSDLQKWATDHDIAFPVLMDGQGAQLSAYFPVSAVPVNIVVNPRTMEVLAVDVGEVDDNQAYEQGFLSGL
jgi:hypothetical protein